METFSDNHDLKEIIQSLSKRSDGLKYFKLLWSTVTPDSGEDFRRHSPMDDMPRTIMRLMCTENQSINDYLFNNYNVYYTHYLWSYLRRILEVRALITEMIQIDLFDLL